MLVKKKVIEINFNHGDNAGWLNKFGCVDLILICYEFPITSFFFFGCIKTKGYEDWSWRRFWSNIMYKE